MKAAYIDDDYAVRLLVSMAFQSAGHICHQYACPTHLGRKHEDLDVIITDAHMGPYDWTRTMNEANLLYRGVPVIVYSGDQALVNTLQDSGLLALLKTGEPQHLVDFANTVVLAKRAE